MTELPKSLKVGIHIYTLQVVEDLHRIKEDGSKVVNSGQQDYLKLEIRVKADLPKSVEAEVLMHEIIHAMLQTQGYDDHDEVLVDGMANLICALIQHNPGLIAYLQSALAGYNEVAE